MKLFQNRFSGELAEPIFYRNIIGETLSLIYSPFYGNKTRGVMSKDDGCC